MTINQQLDDAYADNAVDMQQVTAGIVIAMMRVLNRYDAPLMAALLVAIDQIPTEQFTMARLDAVLGEVQQINSTAYAEVMRELEPQLAGVVEHESDWQYALLLGLLPPVLSVNQTRSVDTMVIAQNTPFQGNVLRDWMNSLAAGRLTKIKNAVRTGFMNGESPSEIVSGIRGTRAKKFSDGILQQSRVDLETIVRTAVSHFVETTKEQFNKANDHLIKLVRWLSILDSRTSHWCIARADKLYTPVKHSPVGHNVPWLSGPGRLHFRCRSTASIVIKSWRELGLSGLSESERNALDGKVPPEQTFADFLSKQSAARQDQILGKERAKLYRDGNLSIGQMFKENGMMLTLEQLRSRK